MLQVIQWVALDAAILWLVIAVYELGNAMIIVNDNLGKVLEEIKKHRDAVEVDEK